MVFLHGWGVSSKIFEPLFQGLKSDYLIYAPDLPGFGGEPIEKAMNLKDYAEWVYEFLKNKNIENPVIVGHSFGGAVAARLALLHPERVSKLVLAGAAAIRRPGPKTKFIRKLSGILSPFVPDKWRRILIKILKLEKSDYAQIENLLLKETFKTVISEDLTPLLNSLSAPTLVIWGEKDEETPLEEGRLIAGSIPNARLEIIKSAGHFMFLEKPEEFIKLIKNFSDNI